MKRALLVFALCASVRAVAMPSLELEVGAGAHGWTDAAPAFSGRVGLDLWDWFTPGVRVMSLSAIGAETTSWAVLGELRAHTRGLVQFNGGLGLGFATASVSTGDGVQASTNAARPYLVGDIGLRVNFWRMWVGLNVGASPMQPGWLGMLSVGIAPFGRD